MSFLLVFNWLCVRYAPRSPATASPQPLKRPVLLCLPTHAVRVLDSGTVPRSRARKTPSSLPTTETSPSVTMETLRRETVIFFVQNVCFVFCRLKFTLKIFADIRAPGSFLLLHDSETKVD